ncbi:MAG: hypothetical protein ACRDUT_00105 [Mycobacterium sp.]
MPPDIVLVSQNVAGAPKDYTLPAGQEFEPLSVRADIDGSGAAGDFLPALQVIDTAGHVMMTLVTSASVSAGSSASVTWAPFLSVSAPGIRFDYPNSGGYLDITTGNVGWSLSGYYTVEAAGGYVVNSDGSLSLVAGTGVTLAALSSDLSLEGATSATLEATSGDLSLLGADNVGIEALADDITLSSETNTTISAGGSFQVQAGGGITFALPVTDPHSGGFLWNNAGVVTVSSG